MRRSRCRVAVASGVAIAALTLGCDMFRSDAENAQRRAAAEHARRVAAMQEATRQTPAGTPVAGDDLRALVRGRTHVSIYEQSPGGRHERYVEYFYFRPDGRLVYVNTLWATRAEAEPGDRWRVDGPRLCLVNRWLGPEERCYDIAVTPAGRVQWFIDRPGTDVHGLLTRVVDVVQEGPPQLEARAPTGGP